MKDSILILCGDKRSTELCRLLETEDRPVRHIPALPDYVKLWSAIEQAKVIVLPTPVSRGPFLPATTH